MGTDKQGFGKGKKTKKPKSPVDEFDPKLDKYIQMSLPIKLTKKPKDIDAFHSSTSFNGNVNDNA